MGRPRKHLKGKHLQRVRDMAAAGAPQRLMASRLNVRWPRWKELRDEDSAAGRRLRDALESGDAELEDFLVGRLREIAKDNKTASATAALFLLKSRFNYSDSPRPEPAQSNVVVVLPQALTAEEWRERVQAGREVKQIGATNGDE